MLNGTADPDAIARGAPALDGLDTPELTLDSVELVQLLAEIRSGPLEALLPPALHPTLPPVVAWVFHRVPDSPWGPFQILETRLACRSGLRPRGYLVGGITDNPAAAEALARRWGYRLHPGTLELRPGYTEHRIRAHSGDRLVVELALRNPTPLGAHDVQFVAVMHPAHTPHGFRLVQCDPRYEVLRAERGEPRIVHFDADAFGDARIEPVYPISAAFCLARVTLPRLRFVCRADLHAFYGTEPVDAGAAG